MLSAQAPSERSVYSCEDLGQPFVATKLPTCGPSLLPAACEKICGSLRCRLFPRYVETWEEFVVAVAGTENGFFSSYWAHSRGSCRICCSVQEHQVVHPTRRRHCWYYFDDQVRYALEYGGRVDLGRRTTRIIPYFLIPAVRPSIALRLFAWLA